MIGNRYLYNFILQDTSTSIYVNPMNALLCKNEYQQNPYKLFSNVCLGKKKETSLPQQCETLPRPGFEPGLLRPQRRVLTTRRSRLTGDLVDRQDLLQVVTNLLSSEGHILKF